MFSVVKIRRSVWEEVGGEKGGRLGISQISSLGHKESYRTVRACGQVDVNLRISVTIKTARASLVAQWLSVSLPMQGTRVRALLWEDPTCRGATRSVSHNY